MADASSPPCPVLGAKVDVVIQCPARRLRRSVENGSISSTWWIGIPKNGKSISCFGEMNGGSRVQTLAVVGRAGVEGRLKQVGMGSGWRRNDEDAGGERVVST